MHSFNSAQAMHINRMIFGSTRNIGNPTIILVPGAWHKADLYAPLLNSLTRMRFPVVAPSLPSVGGTSDNFDDDVRLIREAIAAEVLEGHDIIMVMHSYGGMVGSAAVKGYSEQELGGGRGVIRLIYMTAFALEEGVSLMAALGHKALPWWRSANQKQWQAVNTSRIFYNDVDPELAEALAPKLDLQSKGSFESKQTYAAWKHIDSTYIVCEYDNAIPKQMQVAMANQAGGKFTIEYLAAGHSPFLSAPQQTVDIIRKAAFA